MRTYVVAQETLLNALWQPKWEGNPKKKKGGCICVYQQLIYFTIQ